MKRFSKRFDNTGEVSETYAKSKVIEARFRAELEKLLTPDISINRASKYTENATQYIWDERIEGHPMDYLATINRMVIAAFEVTSGRDGYSWAGSSMMPIYDGKLKPMEPFNEGFLILYVKVGEPHFVWADMRSIRKSASFTTEELEIVWKTKPAIWREGLESLAETLIELAKQWKT